MDQRHRRARTPQAQRPPRAWLAACAVVAAVYTVSLLAVHRDASGYTTLWDGWLGNVASTLPAIPVVLRVRRRPRMRFAWAAIAAGITLNSVANLEYLFHDQNLDPIPYPGINDVLYIAGYLGLIVGVGMMAQHAFGARHVSVRLDALLAGFALASVVTAIWFEPLLEVSGNRLQVAVGLAYPLSSLVLLVLLVATIAPQGFRPTRATLLMAAGVGLFVFGDVEFLSRTNAGDYVGGTWLESTWVIGLVLMAFAAWSDDEARRLPGHRLAPAGLAVVPVVAGSVSVAMLGVSLHWSMPVAAEALALAALVLVLVRMVVTLGEVRRAANDFRDARTDPLTALANRRGFVEDLTAKLDDGAVASGDRHVGLLLLDLDGFKEVNDSLGHLAGDELLRIVADRLEHRLAGRGSLARIGGDEFATACIVASRDALVGLAREVATAVDDPFTLDGVLVRVGVSIGVSCSPGDGITPTELLRSADVAMYEAKRGQLGVSVYHAENDLNSRERLALVHDLRVAIGERALVLHFQPMVDARTDLVAGVEALVRWEHPEHGLMPPDDFVPLAERVGIITQLTRTVLSLAVDEMARQRSAGRLLRMNVNISRVDLLDEALPGYVHEQLARHALDPHQLVLEITESALGEDVERIIVSIAALRERGVRIAIDDFGVGYSSMSQLLSMPIDELKIDRSFVFALQHDRRALAIVDTTIDLARALDLTVVAEGVEDADTLATLRQLGVDVVQGYHLARPMPAGALDDYLAPRSLVTP